MADKSAQLVLDALSRAVSDPTGVPLFGSKAQPGLFAATGPAKAAAQRCKEEDFLRVVRTETRGKTASEICALTNKGLSYLLSHSQPRDLLEDLVRAVEARQGQLDGIAAAVQQTRAEFGAFKSAVETVLKDIVQKSQGNGALNDLWQRFQASGGRKPPVDAGTGGLHPPLATSEDTHETTVLSLLEQWHSSGASEDCPLPELYRRACRTHGTLSIGGFHDVLRRLQEHGQVYLHPWTGPLYDLPEPPFALLVGHEIAYYASRRSS